MKIAYRRTLAAASVSLILNSPIAGAQETAASTEPVAKDPQNYIGLMGSFLDLDKGRIPEYGTGIDLYYGRQLSGNFFLEGHLFTQNFETDLDDATDFYRHGLGVDLVYSLGERLGFSPFALIGGGGNYNDVVPDGKDAFDVSGNAGLGFVTQPLGLYGLRFRAEARYVYDHFDGGQHDFRYSAGLELPLLPYDKPHYTSPAAPIPAEVVRTEVRTESLADSDGDGVPDQGDKCPATPQGMPVDGVGCGLSQVITLTGVTFDFDQATLTPNSRTILEGVALKVKHFNSVPMTLEGHTDSKGSDEYNLKLSDMRAKSVRDFLIEQGVSGDKLTAKGLGESKPVADNDTEAGRALNRRVELHIAGQEAPSVPVDATGAPLADGTAAPAAAAPAEAAPAEAAPAEATPADAAAAPAESPTP